MRLHFRFFAAFLALLALLGLAPRARAQGAALSTNYPVSVRAAGMAGCGSALFWGGVPDSWNNPALLGYQEGLRYETARSHLVPDLAPNIFFTTKRAFAGAYGLGFVFAGKPIDALGSTHLDYGPSLVTSPTGEVLGTFSSFEDVNTWGVGLSFGRAASALAHAFGGRLPRLAHYADVAIGMNHKDVELVFSPFILGLPDEGHGAGKSDDRGIFYRVSPYDSFDGRAPWAALDRTLRVSWDVAYGASTLNRRQPLVTFPAAGFADPMVEERHRGWSTRIAVEPRALERHFADHHQHWLAESLFPTVSFGAAWERNTLDYYGYDFTSNTSYPARSHIVNRGWELTLFSIASLRHGHVSDPDGSVHGASTGWSLGYTFARAVGFRYDHATVPQATDPGTGQRLADVRRKAWTFFIDPVGAIAYRHGRGLGQP